MTTSTVNNYGVNYLESTLAPANNLTKSSSTGGSMSTFAQLLGSSASSTTAGDSSTNSPTQMLAQLMASFQTAGIQNEGSTTDPMSIG